MPCNGGSHVAFEEQVHAIFGADQNLQVGALVLCLLCCFLVPQQVIIEDDEQAQAGAAQQPSQEWQEGACGWVRSG